MMFGPLHAKISPCDAVIDTGATGSQAMSKTAGTLGLWLMVIGGDEEMQLFTSLTSTIYSSLLLGKPIGPVVALECVKCDEAGASCLHALAGRRKRKRCINDTPGIGSRRRAGRCNGRVDVNRIAGYILQAGNSEVIVVDGRCRRYGAGVTWSATVMLYVPAARFVA